MQRAYGKPLHRTTLWRRQKRDEVESRLWKDRLKEAQLKGRFPPNKGGRQQSSDRLDESFLLFSAAAIDLHNNSETPEFGPNFSDVFANTPTGKVGFRYHKAPDQLLAALVRSGFNPKLLAIVVADLLPLNLLSRGGPYSASKRELEIASLRALVDRKFAERVNDQESDRLYGRIADSNLRPIRDDLRVRELGRPYADLSDMLDPFLAEIDERLGFTEPQGESPGLDMTPRKAPRRKKGTPVYKIPFSGGLKISRPMVCYWKNDRRKDFNRCCAFVQSLLKNPLPAEPSPYRGGTVAKFANATFVAFIKKRRNAREQAQKRRREYAD